MLKCIKLNIPEDTRSQFYGLIFTVIIVYDKRNLFCGERDRQKGARITQGVVLGYGLDDRGFESRQELGILLSTTGYRPALGPTQPPIQWVSLPLTL